MKRRDGRRVAPSTTRFIPVAEPVLGGNEQAYVLDCLQRGWVSSGGEYVARFEAALAEAFRIRHALVCSSGTSALHLALAALGIGPGDEVIVPTLTFVATANAVRYLGAMPVLVDCDEESWVLSPEAVKRAITDRTKAIIPVHLYGHPAPMDELLTIARRHGLGIVEDAAEAHGATYKGRPVGGIGNAGILSFFGNKIITTGEGGALLTDDDELAARVRLLRGQGQHPDRRYWFIEVGFNYRMGNLQAALGLAQLERLDFLLERRRQVAGWYKAAFNQKGVDLQFQVEQPWAKSAMWMTSVVLPPSFPLSRDETMRAMLKLGIETRPIFYPMHLLPPSLPSRSHPCPTATRIALNGLSLPSSSSLSEDKVEYVARSLVALGRQSVASHATAASQHEEATIEAVSRAGLGIVPAEAAGT